MFYAEMRKLKYSEMNGNKDFLNLICPNDALLVLP
jgi:hypothetical protein